MRRSFLLLVGLFSLGTASAQTTLTWTGSALNGNFTSPANWTPVAVPNDTTTVLFRGLFLLGNPLGPSGIVEVPSLPGGLPLEISRLLVDRDRVVLTGFQAPALLRASGGSAPNAAQAGVVVSGSTVAVAPGYPGQPTPPRAGLLLHPNLQLQARHVAVGTSPGDDSELVLAGGHLVVEPGTTLAIGNGHDGAGALRFAPTNYGRLRAATVHVSSTGIFDTQNANGFAWVETLRVDNQGRVRVGNAFQLWLERLELEPSAVFEWSVTPNFSQIWFQRSFTLDAFHANALLGDPSRPALSGSQFLRVGNYHLDDNTFTLGDNITLVVDLERGGFGTNPYLFNEGLELARVVLGAGSGIEWRRGNIGISAQDVRIGPSGFLRDSDDGAGGPNSAGNLTLHRERGLSVTRQGEQLFDTNGNFLRRAGGLVTVEAGATLRIDGGSFFAEEVAREAGNREVFFTGLVPIRLLDTQNGPASVRAFRENGNLAAFYYEDSNEQYLQLFDLNGNAVETIPNAHLLVDEATNQATGVVEIGGANRRFDFASLAEVDNWVFDYSGAQPFHPLTSTTNVFNPVTGNRVYTVVVNLATPSVARVIPYDGSGAPLPPIDGVTPLGSGFSLTGYSDPNATVGPGVIEFISGTYGQSKSIVFDGTPASTLSTDPSFRVTEDKTLFTYEDILVGSGNPSPSTQLTLDGGTLAARAIVSRQGGSFVFNQGSVRLSNPLAANGWVVGTLNASSKLNGSPFTLSSGDTHFGNHVDGAGTLSGDFTLGFGSAVQTSKLTVLDSGTLAMDGGYLVLSGPPVLGSGATFDWRRGTLQLDYDVTLGTDELLGNSVDVSAWKSLSTASMHLGTGSRLAVTGGYFRTWRLTSNPNGQLEFTTGTIDLTSFNLALGDPTLPDRPFGDRLVLGPQQNLSLNGLALESGSFFDLQGGLLFANTLTVASSARAEFSGERALGQSWRQMSIQNSGSLTFETNPTPVNEFGNPASATALYATILNNGAISIDGALGGDIDFHGPVTNNGTFKITVPTDRSSTLRFLSLFTNRGAFQSDPATNVFGAGLVVEGNGVLAGQAGDVFVMLGGYTNTSSEPFAVSEARIVFGPGTQSYNDTGRADQAFGTFELRQGARLVGDVTTHGTFVVSGSAAIEGAARVFGNLVFELDSLGFRGLDVSGLLSFTGNLIVRFAPGFVPTSAFSVNLFPGGTGSGFAPSGIMLAGGGSFDPFTGEFSYVPEPSTYALLAGGSSLLLVLLRRRRL